MYFNFMQLIKFVICRLGDQYFLYCGFCVLYDELPKYVKVKMPVKLLML